MLDAASLLRQRIADYDAQIERLRVRRAECASVLDAIVDNGQDDGRDDESDGEAHDNEPIAEGDAHGSMLQRTPPAPRHGQRIIRRTDTGEVFKSLGHAETTLNLGNGRLGRALAASDDHHCVVRGIPLEVIAEVPVPPRNLPVTDLNTGITYDDERSCAQELGFGINRVMVALVAQTPIGDTRLVYATDDEPDEDDGAQE